MRVLEVGCGTGQLSLPLAPLVTEWTATDLSSRMIAELQKRPLPTNLCPAVQDATRLPYDALQFDAVVVANTLHIMPEPEQALHEIHRVLTHDGLLIAPTFIKDEHQQRRKLWVMERLGFKIFYNWTAEELGTLITDSRFTLENMEIIPAHPSSECLLIAKRLD